MSAQTNSVDRPATRLQVRVMEGISSCDPPQQTFDVSPYVQVFILLAGEQRFHLDGKLFELDASQGPVAGLFCIARRASLTFLKSANVMMRKIKIIAPIDWVHSLSGGANGGVAELGQFFSEHLNHYMFTPSAYMIQIAEQVFHPPPSMRGELLTLYREARGLELMSLVCRSLLENRRQAPATSVLAVRQSERVRDYILSHLTDMLEIERIAGEVGASARTIQRHFKEHFGMTVFEYVRRKRLEAARDGLEREGLTVAQAAYVAGYAHTSNFTVAFKKLFGSTPGLRRR